MRNYPFQVCFCYVPSAIYDSVVSLQESQHLSNMLLLLFFPHLQLTPNAIKDYNRARTYLADLANRDGVPVFEDILEAVNCAITRLSESL